MFEPIDIYFERQGPGFWAEPVNAMTNWAFVIAALWLRWRLRRMPDLGLRVLIVLIALIGAGSFAFHTYANRLTMLFDVLFIAIFVYMYLGLFARRVLGWHGARTAGGLIGFAAFSFAFGALLGPALGALASYLPVLIGLVAVAVVAAVRHSAAGPWLSAAASVFVVSLAARTIDGIDAWAAAAPGGIGTHWLWHVLNACVLGFAVWGLARHGAGRASGHRLTSGIDV